MQSNPNPFRRAMVTGASSGIGEQFARELAADGLDLVVVARRTERLTALAEELTRDLGTQIEVVTADLLDPTGLAAVAARLGEGPPIDLLINNAGFGDGGPFVDSRLERGVAQVGIHITAMMTLTHAALNAMRAMEPTMPDGPRGGICNVSSAIAFQPFPTAAVYSAAKGFTNSFSEAVRIESVADGIHVSALCPGFTDTDMLDADATLRKLPAFARAKPQVVARKGIDGVIDNTPLVVPGAFKITAGLSDVLPRSAMRALGHVVNRAG